MLKNLSTLMLLSSIPLLATESTSSLLPKNNSFELGLTLDYTIEGSIGDPLDNSAGLGLNATYHLSDQFDKWALNFKYKNFSGAEAPSVRNDSFDIQRTLLSLQYNVWESEHQASYVSAGVGSETFSNDFREDSTIIGLGLGYRYQMTERVGMIAEGLYRKSPSNDGESGLILSLGANYSF